jgi:hypothetical protein
LLQLIIGVENATDFCMLVLYPETSLNSLVHPSRHLVESLHFCIYNVICEQRKMISCLSICLHFITFSCLIALVKTFSTIWNKSGELGHPCVVPVLKKMLPFFSSFRIFSVGFTHRAFIILRYDPSLPKYSGFYKERMLNFTKSFSSIYWNAQVIYVLPSVEMLHLLFCISGIMFLCLG